MARVAGLAWLAIAVLGLVVAGLQAGDPRIECPPDATPHTYCQRVTPEGLSWLRYFATGAVVEAGVPFLLAYFVAIRRSHTVAVIGAVVAFLFAAPSLTALLMGAGPVVRDGPDTLRIVTAGGWLVAGVLSALAAREIAAAERGVAREPSAPSPWNSAPSPWNSAPPPPVPLRQRISFGKPARPSRWRILLAVPSIITAGALTVALIVDGKEFFAYWEGTLLPSAIVLAPWVGVACATLFAPRGTGLLVTGAAAFGAVIPLGILVLMFGFWWPLSLEDVVMDAWLVRAQTFSPFAAWIAALPTIWVGRREYQSSLLSPAPAAAPTAAA